MGMGTPSAALDRMLGKSPRRRSRWSDHFDRDGRERNRARALAWRSARQLGGDPTAPAAPAGLLGPARRRLWNHAAQPVGLSPCRMESPRDAPTTSADSRMASSRLLRRKRTVLFRSG